MIGDLYNANNVVVGQAATFFAPQQTALPNLDGWNAADPFDPTMWVQAIVAASATLSAGTFTLTYTYKGNAYTTSALQYNASAATVKTALLTALAPLNPATTDVMVSGGPPSATTTPLLLVLADRIFGGVWSLTPTGITGGTLSVTQPIWTPTGATDQGWQFGADKSTQVINIEEQSTPVGTTITSQNVTLAAALSEDITKTLALALNASAVAVAKTTTKPGYDLITLSDDPIYYAVGMVTVNAEGFGRVIYAPKWTQLQNANVTFRRASDKRSYPAQFSTVCKPSEIQILNFTAAHS